MVHLTHRGVCVVLALGSPEPGHGGGCPGCGGLHTARIYYICPPNAASWTDPQKPRLRAPTGVRCPRLVVCSPVAWAPPAEGRNPKGGPHGWTATTPCHTFKILTVKIPRRLLGIRNLKKYDPGLRLKSRQQS